MNYSNLYNKLIQNAQTRGYDHNETYHIHHIKPASMCRISQRYKVRDHYVWDIDADTKSNLVMLTPREHYIAHLLLAKLYTQMVLPLALWQQHSKNSKAFSAAMEHISQHQQLLWESQTHNFTGLNNKRVLDGTHNFLLRDDGSSMGRDVQQQRVTNGTHHFQGEHGAALAVRRNKKMLDNGTHASINHKSREKVKATRQIRIDNGDWHTCGVRPWYNNSTKEHSRMIYASANDMYVLWVELRCGSRRLATLLEHEWSSTHDRIVKMFRDGWVPSLDNDWVRFQSSFGE